MRMSSKLAERVARFQRDEAGTSTLEFTILFPVVILIFLAALEVGLWSTRQVMLEHGLDQTVREVRLGAIREPDHRGLIDRVCAHAGIIPDCENQLRLQMIPTSVTDHNPAEVNGAYACRDRNEDANAALLNFANTGSNNELMVLRVCALFDPLVAHLSVGKSVKKEDGGGVALYAASGYVMEPFQ